jgi:hypothetical protein
MKYTKAIEIIASLETACRLQKYLITNKFESNEKRSRYPDIKNVLDSVIAAETIIIVKVLPYLMRYARNYRKEYGTYNEHYANLNDLIIQLSRKLK